MSIRPGQESKIHGYILAKCSVAVLLAVVVVAAACGKKTPELRGQVIITDYDFGTLYSWNPSTRQVTTIAKRGLWAAHGSADGVLYALRQTNPVSGIRDALYGPDCDAVVNIVGREPMSKALFTQPGWALSDLAVTNTQLIVLMHRPPKFDIGRLVWLSYDGKAERELEIPLFVRKVAALPEGGGLLLSETRYVRDPRIRLLDRNDRIKDLGPGSYGVPLTAEVYVYEDHGMPSCIHKRSLDGQQDTVIRCGLALVGQAGSGGRYLVVSRPTPSGMAEYTELDLYDLKTGDLFPIMKVGKNEPTTVSWSPK